MTSMRFKGLLALVVAVTACGGGASPSTTTAATSTTGPSPTTSTTTAGTTTTTEAIGELTPYGGEVVIGVVEEPRSLDWIEAGGAAGVLAWIGAGVWTGVAEVDGATLELVPDVVTELPTVANGGLVINPDGTETVTYHIDPMARWADGTPITGADFAYTYDRIMDPAALLDRSGYDLIVAGSISAGESTFSYTVSRPTLAVETLFDALIPAHQVEGSAAGEWTRTMWVSGGPFEFEQWSQGEFLTLIRNPNYWKADGNGQHLPYLDRVVFRFVPDVDSLVSEFLERNLDLVLLPGWDPDAVGRLASVEGVVVDVVGNGQWEHLAFQFGDGRLQANPGSYNTHLEYRRAVAHAIDRQALADAVTGGWSEGMDSYVEAFTPDWSEAAWAQYDHDPDQAREYLAQLCAKPGVDCAANPPKAVFATSEQRGAIALALEGMFTAVGIEFETRLYPRVVYLGETIEFGTFDLGDWTWRGSPGLSDLAALHRVWDPDQAPPLGANYYRFGSPGYEGEGDEAAYDQGPSGLVNAATGRFAEIYDALAVTVDEAAVRALVAEAEQILAGEVAFIPLFQNPDGGAVWADEIAGYRHLAGLPTWNVARWYRIDG